VTHGEPDHDRPVSVYPDNARLSRYCLASTQDFRPQSEFFLWPEQALFNNNLDIAPQRVTAIIGPSGCGKSTHIRVYNRIFELYPDYRAQERCCWMAKIFWTLPRT